MIALTAGVLGLVYSTPGLADCFWRFYDSDLWYSVATLRWLDGLTIDLYEDPGYSHIQIMGWLYFLAMKVGVLNEITYQDLVSDPDPLLSIREHVLVGWSLSATLLILTAGLMFRFAKMITSSNMAGFVASSLVLCSWSTVQFLWKIKAEPLSALCGLGSMFFMFKALRSTRLVGFVVGFVISGMLLYLALLSKLNAYVLLPFLPVVCLLELECPLDRLSRKELRSVVWKVFFMCISLLPFTGLVMKIYLQEMVSLELFGISIYSHTFFLFFLLLVSFLRARMRNGGARQSGMVGYSLLQMVTCILLFMIAFQLVVALSFLHPSPNIYVGALVVCCIAAGLFMVSTSPRIAMALRWLKNHSDSKHITYAVLITPILIGVLWFSTEALGWMYPRMHYYAAATQPGADISRSVFHMLNLDHSTQVYVAHDATKVGVVVYLWQALQNVINHFMRYRWAELIGIASACFLLRRRFPRETLIAVFLMLVGIGSSLVSAVRGLVDFYVIYEDLFSILSVATCLGFAMRRLDLGRRRSWMSSKQLAFAGLAVVLLFSSLTNRLGWVRDVSSGKLPYRIVLTNLMHLYPTQDPTSCKALSDVPEVPEGFIYPRAGYW